MVGVSLQPSLLFWYQHLCLLSELCSFPTPVSLVSLPVTFPCPLSSVREMRTFPRQEHPMPIIASHPWAL